MSRHARGRWAHLLVATLLAAASPAAAHASGDCAPAQEKLVHSANGRFAVRIVPGHFGDPVAAPSADAAQPPADRPARAVLYRVLAGGEMKVLSTFDLHSSMPPVKVLLSNDGQRLVTSGDWCSSPGSMLSFLIYGADGELVRVLYPLERQLSYDIFENVYPSDWLQGSRIDDETNRLVLDISGCPLGDCAQRVTGAIEIEIGEGKLVRAGPPLPTYEPGATIGPYPAEDAAALGGFREQCPEHAAQNLPHLPFESLDVLHLVQPVYTETARRARVEGRVVLQLALQDGAVRCAAVLEDLPMGLGAAARDAAIRWRFRPASRDQLRATTTVAVDFAVLTIPPPKN